MNANTAQFDNMLPELISAGVTDVNVGVQHPDMDSAPRTHPCPTRWHPSQSMCFLVPLLPDTNILRGLLGAFRRRAQPYFHPHLPDKCSNQDVEQYLIKVKRNADLCPDTLAMIFAMLAQGVQCGVYDRCGETWGLEARKEETRGDVFGRYPFDFLRSYRLIDISSRSCYASATKRLVHEQTNTACY